MNQACVRVPVLMGKHGDQPPPDLEEEPQLLSSSVPQVVLLSQAVKHVLHNMKHVSQQCCMHKLW